MKHEVLTLNEEFEQVMAYLGRKREKGEVRNDHLSKVLMYVLHRRTEEYQKTIQKLCLICGIAQRVVRENYFQPLEAFGWIELFHIQSDKHWRWVGIQDDLPFQNVGDK